MNSAAIAVFGIVWFVVAYRIYGRFIERKLMQPEEGANTPAHTLNDGVDFYPANPLILFGHHFASIAGAGPIIGPVIAASVFGFGLSVIWILLGAVFMGAVHDYTTLIVSVRHDGKSIPEVTKDIIGPRARILFQIFVLITLVFVIAVFAISAAKSFVADGRIVIPAFGLIPLAMVFGWLVNRAGFSIIIGTILALVALMGLFIAGDLWPVSLPLSRDMALQVWIGVLVLYGFVAAVLPVWVLLQPRDYLAYWILVAGMVFGFGGLLISNKPVVAPFLTTTVSESQGPVWPMLFILIACGAVSGFHSLVSSGTTAKQLSSETHGKAVAFGGMITEGALALLALLAVTAGLAYDRSGAVEGGVPSLLEFIAPGGGGPVTAFAAGFGVFTEPLLKSAGVLLGMLMLNAFILTTLDTSVRLTRLMTAELLGPIASPFKNRFVATILPVLLAYLLAASGSEGTLWPMFGAANQLVAALALLVVTVYLARLGRPKLYTLVPAIFMLITTVAALLWKGRSLLTAKQPQYGLSIATLVLLALAVYVSIEGLSAIRREQIS